MFIRIRKNFTGIALLAFFILLPVTSTVKSQEEPYVRFKKVEVATTPQKKTLYRLDYVYKFEGYETVYIKELGFVPAQGHLIYFADDIKVEFRDPTNGSIIKIVNYPVIFRNEEWSFLRRDSISARAYNSKLNYLGGIDLPTENEFLEIARSESWVSPPTFQEIVLSVLNKKFPLGIKPFQRDNLFFFVTPYIELSGLPSNLRGQLALLISQPYGRNGNKFLFRVQPLIREKRRREATWKKVNISKETQRAASNLIDEVLNELKKPEAN